MDETRARELLGEERVRVQSLLEALRSSREADRTGARELGDMSDPSESLVSEGTDDAVARGLELRLAALERADVRLASGTFGRSVASGDPIPDERLEADPAAELTVEEAQKLA